jgi:HTH-type transcriptional regulator, competence development regulator
MNISVLGSNIKRIRELKGISAYKLAKAAGIGASTISQIETGNRQSLTSKTIEKIAAVLDITPNELLEMETGREYVVSDLLDTFEAILSSDEVTIDNIEMTEFEKKQALLCMSNFIDMIRLQRKEK